MKKHNFLWCLTIGGLAFGCHSDREDGVVSRSLFKLEWGATDDSGKSWAAQVQLEGAEVKQIEPYSFEDNDTMVSETLNFYSWTEGFMTDGVLLDLEYEEGATLSFLAGFGAVLTVALDRLTPGRASYLTIEGNYYLLISGVTQSEWDTAVHYNGIEGTRSDNLPRPAYEAHALKYRNDSETSAAEIADAALARYETDSFFAYAEDLRRAVSEQLYVVIPSVLAVGETFDIAVVAVDINGRVVMDFGEEVDLSVDGTSISVPDVLGFESGEFSIVASSGTGLAVEPGIALLRVHDPSGRFEDGGIPVRVEQDPSVRLFWGDLHTHSVLSDGDFGDVYPEDVYEFGRDVGRLDFVAVTDHDYRRPIPDWKWSRTIEAARAYYEVDRFVPFVGYEWSAEHMWYSDVIGHKNVIYRSDSGPMYSAWDPEFNTPEKLWAALRRDPGLEQLITIPHHPVRRIDVSEDYPQYGGPGTDWRYHDEELQTLVEVYSRWGSSEITGAENPRPVRDARDTGSGSYAVGLGYRMGLIASSDSHDGKPGMSVLPARLSINAYPTGLVAAMAHDLSRESVFDALSARRCYGTSGSRRMLLDMETEDGVGLGEVGSSDGPPTFKIFVAGTTKIRTIDLVRVDDVSGALTVWTGNPDGWLEQAVVENDAFPSEGIYYVRVTQEDNEMGWMGPIFLVSSKG